MTGSKALLNELSDAVVSGNVHKARKLAERIASEGVSATAAFDRLRYQDEEEFDDLLGF